jgi:hypothetical protein
MRPLIHLGIGPDSIDHQLFVANEALYDQLMERGHQLIEDAKKEFMEHYYNNPPKKTLDELKKECNKLLDKKSQFIDLEAPNIILDDLDNQIVSIYQKIQNKDYGKFSDSVYKKYREMMDKETKYIFGGRLTDYKYYDMHQVIGSALSKSQKENIYTI